jgi:hypothetical protein
VTSFFIPLMARATFILYQSHSQTAVEAANTAEQAELQPEPRRYMPLRLNRNFMNYPLARDPRVAATWRLGNHGGDWYAVLPGENRIPLDAVNLSRK